MKMKNLATSLLPLLLGGMAHGQSVTNGVFTGNLKLDPNTAATPPQAGNLIISGVLDVYGNTLNFGSAGSTANPAAVLTYTDDASGPTSTIASSSFRNSLSWKWQQNSSSGQKSKMLLDQNNKLSLFDLSGVSKITLDPVAGQIAVNGQNLLVPNASGNVGIGTASPAARLALTAATGANDVFAIANSAGTRLLTVNSTGNLGIGVLPGTGTIKLDVSGQMRVTSTMFVGGAIQNSTTGANASLTLGTLGSVLTRGVADASPVLTVQNTLATSTGDILQLKNSSATVLSVKSSGNVGIGAATPGEKLSLSGRLNLLNAGAAAVDNSSFNVEVAADPANTLTTAMFIYPKDSDSHRLYFGKAGRTFFGLDFSYVSGLGNVPPFTTNDQLTFGADAGASHNIARIGGDIIYHSGAPSGGNHIFYTSDTYSGFEDSPAEAMRITPTGKVGIGNSTPVAKLDVAGDIKASGVIRCAPGGDIPMYSGN